GEARRPAGRRRGRGRQLGRGALRDTAEGARRLAAGEAIAFPTETVYGLGADATNAAAVARIYALKERPADHPLIVHVADAAAMVEWVEEVPPAARALVNRFWPGPLTII